MHRGEIRWYTFKPPDKRRPVVIVTRESAIPHLGHVTVASITTTIRGIGSEVRLDVADGMKGPCVVNLDHVQTVDKSRIGAVISFLGDEKMDEIRAATLFAWGYVPRNG
jgi:mRNA interferase MazF